jgi:hypothetical protein
MSSNARSKAPFVLLVNPWITDFAAFDLWAKPLGLLTLASLLREGGCGVAFLDCMDRLDPKTATNPAMIPGVEKKYGTGNYPKSAMTKPDVYLGIPRYYYRYGIHPGSFSEQARAFPRPDLIWVTSMMTYWYPGVQLTISLLREIFPDVPIWLGGIYARLCSAHAREKSGADEVVTLPVERLPAKIEAATGFTVKNRSRWGRFRDFPAPALDLLTHATYIPIMTSIGCPFQCPYCASPVLQPEWDRMTSDSIYRQIYEAIQRHGPSDFAFYDDALLPGGETSLKPALERLVGEGLEARFHAPNALHVRSLRREWCSLLYESGFTTIRMGLETSRADRQREWGGKVENEMFLCAVESLSTAGFKREQIGAYLLCGLPGQTPTEVAEAIEFVSRAGAQPYLAEYSPIPGTAMWAEACRLSRYDIENEPLFHNNTFFACRRPDFSYDDMQHLKAVALQARKTGADPRGAP